MFNDKYGLTQAVLEGRKNMTRRICKYDRPDESWDIVFPVFGSKDYDNEGNLVSPLFGAFGWKNKDGDFTGWNNPLYKVGEVVAIAQSYESVYNEKGLETMDMLVSGLKNHKGWQNKLFVAAGYMIHHIRITDIKIERLQDISDEDCLKEGIIKGKCGSESTHFMDAYYVPKEKQPYCTPRDAFAALIDKVSSKGTWESNPFVFVYELWNFIPMILVPR